MRTVVVRDKGVLLNWFNPADLSNEEKKRLKRLVTWEHDSNQDGYVLQRQAAHKVGRVRIRDVVYSVLPDISSQDFTTFFLYSLGVNLERFAENQSSEIALVYGNDHPDFEVLAATLLATTCEELARSYLAKGYVPKRERLNTIRGRIDWSQFLRPQGARGIPCVFSEISLDNTLNQVVLAGLYAAQSANVNPSTRRRLDEMVFVWSSVASRKHVSLEDLQVAEKSINRLTEKYRTALGLCRMLMFGFAPDDFFQGHSTDFQCLEFDLALIFERFVLRRMHDHFSATPLTVHYQASARNALRDDFGSPYRSSRPDFFVLKKNIPVAVFDAKFKPRYVSNGTNGFRGENKVSESDIYQMLFYAQRARQLSGGVPISSFIIAPRLNNDLPLPMEGVRKIHWVHEGEREVTIEVIDVDLPETLSAIRKSMPFPSDGLALACNRLANAHLRGAAL